MSSGAPTLEPEHTLQREFNHIPGLDEVFAHGGQPGIEYALVCAEEIPTFRRRGDPDDPNRNWRSIKDHEMMSVCGYAAIYLARGHAIPDANPLGQRCKSVVSAKLKALVKAANEPPQPAVETPMPPKATLPKLGVPIPAKE